MRPVETPNAPCRIAVCTSLCILPSCFSSGCTSLNPRTIPRTCPAPTSTASLMLGRALRSRRKYPERSVQSIFSLYLRSQGSCSWIQAAFIGAGEMPSPVSSVVIPWRTFDSSRGSISTLSSLCPRRSMNPGAIARSRSSTRRFVFSRERSPTAAMLSPRIPTSARNHGDPVPSTTRPPERIRSKTAAQSSAIMPAAPPPPHPLLPPLRPPRRAAAARRRRRRQRQRDPLRLGDDAPAPHRAHDLLRRFLRRLVASATHGRHHGDLAENSAMHRAECGERGRGIEQRDDLAFVGPE